MIFPFSYGFSYGFPISPWFSYGFPMPSMLPLDHLEAGPPRPWPRLFLLRPGAGVSVGCWGSGLERSNESSENFGILVIGGDWKMTGT